MKRLALNDKGQLTYCSASEENLGKGRCNHILHGQVDSNGNPTNTENFMKLATNFQKKMSEGYNCEVLEDHQDKDLIKLDGLQQKYYQNGCFIKEDTNNEISSERNALSEELCSKLLDCTNIPHANYEMITLFDQNGNEKEIPCIKTKNFLKEHEEMIGIADLLSDEEGMWMISSEDNNYSERLDKLDQIIRKKTGLTDAKKHIVQILTLDILTMNSDRHLNNIGLIFNNETHKYNWAPLYDNGAALLANKECDHLNAYNYYYEENEVLFDPSTFGIGPVDGYINLCVKELKKDKDARIHIDFDKLNETLDSYENKYYPKDQVERIKNILYMQVDEYSSLFIDTSK